MCIQMFNERVEVVVLGCTSGGCGGMIDITYYDFFWKLKLNSKIFKGILLETRLDTYFFKFYIWVYIEANTPTPFVLSGFIK
jgi:hypothetical protein